MQSRPTTSDKWKGLWLQWSDSAEKILQNENLSSSEMQRAFYERNRLQVLETRHEPRIVACRNIPEPWGDRQAQFRTQLRCGRSKQRVPSFMRQLEGFRYCLNILVAPEVINKIHQVDYPVFRIAEDGLLGFSQRVHDSKSSSIKNCVAGLIRECG